MKTRKLNQRMKEHKSDLRLNRPATALSRLTKSRTSKLISFTCPLKDCYEQKIQESIEIVNRSVKAWNETLSYSVPNICQGLIRKQWFLIKKKNLLPQFFNVFLCVYDMDYGTWINGFEARILWERYEHVVFVTLV